jgi:Acyl-CoA dehydrogenases
MNNLDKFRDETKKWLDENCPPSMRSGADPSIPIDEVWGGRNAEYKNPESKLWLDRMGEKGWTMPTVPKEYGGGGLNKEEVKILNEEMFLIGARQPLLSFGIWMLAPVLLEYGNEAQKKEHIPKILKGEIRWCQGYSEPGSGSDLASLSTKAEDAGDHFLVNGQKVWTSYADKADWIFALVRTGAKEPKHDGISFVLIDMATKGVSTKPITLISGKSPFCETFFDNVEVPKENLMENKCR